MFNKLKQGVDNALFLAKETVKGLPQGAIDVTKKGLSGQTVFSKETPPTFKSALAQGNPMTASLLKKTRDLLKNEVTYVADQAPQQVAQVVQSLPKQTVQAVQNIPQQIAQGAQAIPQKIYNVRGAVLQAPDIDEARRIVFSEISNRAPEKQELETRILLNTAINRLNAYKAKGQDVTLTDVLRMKNQYQGYGTNQYKLYSEQATDTPTQKKKEQVDAIINRLLAEIEAGTFQDNTNGAFYYSHKGDKIYYDDRRPLFRQPQKLFIPN